MISLPHLDGRIPLARSALLLIFAASASLGQQVPDLEYNPPIREPAYLSETGPRVAIDEAHHNFHTANGRYKPFAQLLRRDGYVVDRLRKKLSSKSLMDADIVVIANPIHSSNDRNWTLPTPSAYSKQEIAALREWVEAGGSLLLIADHMPFPGGAGELAKSFKIRFSNGFARPKTRQPGQTDRFRLHKGLKESVVTKGRNKYERVTEVVSFTGSAFLLPLGATPILVFGPDWVSLEPKRAWTFTADTPALLIEGWCQGAILEFGQGRVAVFGEAAMFTAQRAGPQKRPMGMSRPEAKQNHKLLLNVMHWLSRIL